MVVPATNCDGYYDCGDRSNEDNCGGGGGSWWKGGGVAGEEEKVARLKTES